jgi:hypothetical protein
MSNKKIVETNTKSIPITHTHDCLPFYLDTGTALKHGRLKLVSWSKPNLLVK